MFRFKQFNLIQENCPMKFGTDSMTLGGFVPILTKLESILDIGSGSGIIALIMAQRTNSIIDAIEIDQGGFLDMNKNFESSKWGSRLSACNFSFIRPFVSWDNSFFNSDSVSNI